MKLFYPIFLFVVLSFNAFAQNWSPIATGDVYHYELVGGTSSSTNPVAATMWIDSVSTNASTGAVTSHLNKIVKPCDNCTLPLSYFGSRAYLQNQPQFLGNDMLVANDCEYTFTLDNELFIKPCAAVGETWIFENSESISAEVIAITAGEILGNADSLKHIALSNGDTLMLSKSHGIIEFPQLDDATYYRLIGIQSRDLGFKIPDYREFFDFNVGDIFQYNIHQVASLPLGIYGTVKIAITDKQVSQESITYEYSNTQRIFYYTTGYGTVPDSVYSIIGGQTEHTHTVDQNNITNFYPNQLFDIGEYCLGASDYNYCGGQNFDFPNTKHALYLEQNQDGKWIKTMYSDGYGAADFDSYFIPIPDSTDLLGNAACEFGCQRIWEEGLGQTYFRHIWFEGNNIRELTAYVINGDTTGTITPDDVLISTDDAIYLNSQITLNPNPASDILQFDIQSDEHLQNIQVKIYDAVGKIFAAQKMGGQQSGSVDISNLPNGIYFISFQTNEGIISRKFIKN